MSKLYPNLLRVGLTVAFVFFGLRKLTGSAADIAIYDAIGFGQWPRPITGSVEVLCAIALWIRPVRFVAALGLVGTMLAGTAALVLFTSMAYWHLLLLGLGAAALAWADRPVDSRGAQV